MIKFEKVSYEQFEKDSISLGFTPTKEIYDSIKLPVRATDGSAGYDFVTPYGFVLPPYTVALASKSATIPTGIRVVLPKDKVLLLVPRSGMGFKTGMRMANTVGVIDSDYYGSDNEGHIMAKFSSGFKGNTVEAGDRVMQGIIIQYFVTDDDENVEKAQRNGGFGSTDSVLGKDDKLIESNQKAPKKTTKSVTKSMEETINSDVSKE